MTSSSQLLSAILEHDADAPIGRIRIVGRNGGGTMTTEQLLFQTALTVVAAGIGAIFGTFLTRHTERYKQLQGLRAAAYVDFLRGVSKLAAVGRDTLKNEANLLEEREGKIIVTDARARIAIYGSKRVVQSLSKFISGGAVLNTDERLHSFTGVCELMRNESTGKTERASFEDVHRLLFS